MGYASHLCPAAQAPLVAPASPCRIAILGRELAMQSQPRAWGHAKITQLGP